MKHSALSIEAQIDTAYAPEASIVLRYRNAFTFGMTDTQDAEFKEWLQKTSIREGARVFYLLTYKDVHLYVLDETSFMHTHTLKSIDGCVTMANCKSRGYDRVVFESGGNTGTALTEYGRRVGLETFLFLPEENLHLLESRVFESEHTHVISVEDRLFVKPAAHLFGRMNGIEHIPPAAWRYQASRFRGAFILEYMLNHGAFNWITQTISAAFGPIGIYSVIRTGGDALGTVPRFLGIQQVANCPLYTTWTSQKNGVTPLHTRHDERLLTRVMYDVEPHTYGTFEEFTGILRSVDGDITTVNHAEFDVLLGRDFDGTSIIDALAKHGVEITVADGTVVEKTGLMALSGTLKEVDRGTIAGGSKVLCCLTSGMSRADGRLMPEYTIPNLHSMIRDYSHSVDGR